MSEYFIEGNVDDIARFAADYPADTPVVMLNLLRFAEQADYGDANEQPCTGFEAFARYGAAVQPLVEKTGGATLWQGQQAATLIGPQDKDWQLVVLVRYPSAQAFLDMITSDAYQAIVHHRTAALADSRLIAHREF